jgi:methyl-accepting chemotaxis protein
VGWIAVMGVVIAVTMGLIAPQLIWRDMRDSTDRIFGSVSRLRELVGRNGRALTEQLQAVTLLNDSMQMLEREAQSISDTTRSLAASAEQSARVSQTGHHTAEMAQRSVLDVRDQVADIGDMMTRLGRRTAEIGDILVFLDQLSEGTKKLSVNASIKASDPKGAARQLGYIAGEMRELAEQALDSTQDIEQRIQEIQKSSEGTSEATKAGRREVERCLESFEDLEAVFSRILRWVDETTQFARNIESSTTTQSESLQTVAESVDALRRRVTETEGNFRDIEDAIDELATLGEELIKLWKVNQ